MSSNVLPATLNTEIETVFGAPVTGVVPVAGGEINRAAQVVIGSEAVFVKWQDGVDPVVFEREARGLELLRATQTLRVPQVLGRSDTVPFLALEWVDEGVIFDRATWSRGFAQGLAALHQASAGVLYGLDEDNFLGTLPQCNERRSSWPEFWRDCRLAPQMEEARGKGLDAERLVLLARLMEQLGRLLDYDARPSLLHGDLWSGNYLTAGSGAVLVDPAAYYGDREAELSYIELFGGFPADFVQYYREVWPLEAGYEQRRPVFQLYHLLAHFNHFGEPYGQDVERICRRVLS